MPLKKANNRKMIDGKEYYYHFPNKRWHLVPQANVAEASRATPPAPAPNLPVMAAPPSDNKSGQQLAAANLAKAINLSLQSFAANF